MKFKILLLSVGSLLGQGILDTLERRREYVTVIGANSQAESVNNFRCDRAYLLPETVLKDTYYSAFESLINKERPQLILPGRDDDVLFLAKYREAHPEWHSAIPCGSASLAEQIHDKYLCFEWAKKRKLPFAESLLYEPGQINVLKSFIARVGFPLVAKPRQGFGSRGVFFVESLDDIFRLSQGDALFLQVYLDDPQQLVPYFEQYKRGMPLFFYIPEMRQFSAQGLIDKKGGIGEAFCAQSTMLLGRTERFTSIENTGLSQLYLRYARALQSCGWQGPVNLQAKPHYKTGEWKAFELNLRMSGGTSCRLMFGFDEIYNLICSFYEDFDFPLLKNMPQIDVVYPCLKNQGLAFEQVEKLNE